MNMSMNDVGRAVPLGVRERAAVIAEAAVMINLGADTTLGWGGCPERVRLNWEQNSLMLPEADYKVARCVAEKIDNTVACRRYLTPQAVFEMMSRAMQETIGLKDDRQGLGVVMLRDNGGCGYWRIRQPARYLQEFSQKMGGKDLYVDITGVGVPIKTLVDYDVIYVQRLHDWESYYLLEKLKRMGKRVIYDIDDDIFNILPSNPACSQFTGDARYAAAACMKLADKVVVSTDELADRIRRVVEEQGGNRDNVVVIPNTIDLSDGWPDITRIGSPDGVKRIIWQGGATHAEDWNICGHALDRVMLAREDVRLVILGFLPPVIREMIKQPHWKNRVEYMSFSDPETYFSILKHIRAEVGLAPLVENDFNNAKSPIKWLEYSAAGVPCVASDVIPYHVIMNGESGILVDEGHDICRRWYDAIMKLLDHPELRVDMVDNARKYISAIYSAEGVAKALYDVIAG